jgi:hypothetical protein
MKLKTKERLAQRNAKANMIDIARAARHNDNGYIEVKLDHPPRKFRDDIKRVQANDLNLGYIKKAVTKKGRIEKRFRRWSVNPKTTGRSLVEVEMKQNVMKL